jgi:hypothetical protein
VLAALVVAALVETRPEVVVLGHPVSMELQTLVAAEAVVQTTLLEALAVQDLLLLDTQGLSAALVAQWFQVAATPTMSSHPVEPTPHKRGKRIWHQSSKQTTELYPASQV